MKIILLLALFIVNAQPIKAQFAGGSGTEDDPYEVETVEQLQEIRDHTDNHFIQMNDIDASETENWNEGKGFNPIGDDVVNFAGSYNGNEYEIHGLFIDRPDEKDVGLFGYVERAEFENIGIINSYVRGFSRVGTLVGYNNRSKVSKSFAIGEVNGKSSRVGGLIGYSNNSSEVIKSYSDCIVIGGNIMIGGLVGQNRMSLIIESYTESEVTGKSLVGGLTGENGGDIIASIGKSKVTGGEKIGGFVGENAWAGNISNSYNMGNASGEAQVGGFVGVNQNTAKISNSYSYGIPSGNDDVGGFAGVNGATIESSYWDSKNSKTSNGIGRGLAGDVTGLTTAQMTGVDAFENMRAFDFEGTWLLTENYPALFWEDVDAIPPPDLDEPAMVVLASPEDSAMDIEINPEFVWNVAEDTETYQIQVSLDEDFQSPAIDEQELGSTSYSVIDQLQYNTTYFWRVRGINLAGNGEWSNTWSFFTEYALDEPVLDSPENDAEDLDIPVTFNWQPVEDASDYVLQVAKDEDFENLLNISSSDHLAKQASSVTETQSQDWTISQKVDNLDFSTEYFWKVKATGDEGIGEWSETRSLTTEDAPITTPVVLLSPDNESSEVPFPVELAWEAFEDAYHYDIQISESSEFKSFISEVGYESTNFSTSDLKDTTTYFWRVRATVDDQKSIWSEVWEFKTGVEVPEITESPNLMLPENESENVSIPVELSWQEFENADYYHIELSLTSSFDTTLTVQSFEGTSIEIEDVIDAHTYFWRVRAKVDEQVTAWSEVWTFETELRVPEVPVWEPADDEIDVETTPNLVWGSSERSKIYHLQVSDQSGFDELVIDIEEIGETEYQLSDELEKGITYHWRVRAGNEAGYSEWSEALQFTTQMPTDAFAEEIPEEFTLEQNYPNPFNPITQISYQLPEQTSVTLEVYSILGQHVKTLVNESQSAGNYEVSFDGSDLSSGTYIYRLEAGNYVESRQMMLVK